MFEQSFELLDERFGFDLGVERPRQFFEWCLERFRNVSATEAVEFAVGRHTPATRRVFVNRCAEETLGSEIPETVPEMYGPHTPEGINATLDVLESMSDTEEIEEIRKQKRENLATKADSPDKPVDVEGNAHLEELLEKHAVVLVDFYADWCGPCKMLAPTVAEIAAETDATVLKIDIDIHQDLAAEYQVQGVPTLYLFENGEVTERMVGVQDKGTLVGKIEAAA